MIWESIPVMTVLDLAFITMAVVGLVILGRARRQWPVAARPVGPALIVVGLVILGLFYTADLFIMFVLPGIVGRAQALVVMEQQHLNYSWITFVTTGFAVTIGAALTFRTVGRTSAELDESQQRLDLTVRQREKAILDLKDAQQRYVDLVGTSVQGIAWADLSDPMPIDLPVDEQIDWIRDKAVFVDCNDVFAGNYGYSKPAEVIGRGVEALWGDYRELSDPFLRRFITNGHAIREDTEAELPNGEIRSFRHWVTGIIHDGHLVRVVASQIDVTEQKRTGAELRESEERFRVLAGAPFEGIAITDAGRVVDCNPQLAEMLGYDPTELIGMEVMDLVAPESRDLVRERIRAGDIEPYGHRAIRKDGTTFAVEARGRSIPFRGQTVRVTAVQDMTRWEEAQRELRESHELLESFIEGLQDGFTVFDSQGTRISANSAFCEMTGYSADELIGSGPLHPRLTHRDEYDAAHQRTLEGDFSSFDTILERKDGQQIPVIINPSCVRGEDGTPQYFLSTVKDISERQRMVEELQILKDRLEAENLYLREEIKLDHDFEQIVGESEPLRRALVQVEQVAPTGSTVLLLGETGTGKELFARAIHGLSGRAERPLVKVDCAALPATLIESELFGHERGAFTGALRQKLGRFELADGGTLFLDEVGDLPLEVQGKLLRVLQDGAFERVGGTEPIHVDVRVVAATNRDLEQAVEAKVFRADLYYRLNVFPLRLPPLRERPEDIPLLAEHFVSKHAKRIGKSIESISGRTLHSLATYSWPGNVRELENRIERAIISTEGPVLDLPLTREVRVVGAARTLREVESKHIRDVLESMDWVIEGDAGAASTLGIAASTLRSRMRKLGITRPRSGA